MTESPQLKRSISSLEEASESEDSVSEIRLASPPPPPKKQRVEEYEKDATRRNAKIKELKTMRINHPNLKIGLTAELDREFNAMTDEELDCLCQNYHLELTGAKPFATGCAAATVIGRGAEYLFGLEGFTQRLADDTHLIANLDQSLPITFVDYGPQLQTVLSLGTHVINAFAESCQWQASTMQPPKSNTPPGSLS